MIIFFLTSSNTSEIFISVSSGRSLNIGTLKTLHNDKHDERNRLLLVEKTTIEVGDCSPKSYLLRKSVYSVCLMRPVLIIIVWKHCRSIAHSLQSVAAKERKIDELIIDVEHYNNIKVMYLL